MSDLVTVGDFSPSMKNANSNSFKFCIQSQLSRVVSDVCALLGAERTRRQELERAELEKAELLERLKNEVLKPCTASQTVMHHDEEHRKPNPQCLTLDYLKKSRDVTVL